MKNIQLSKPTYDQQTKDELLAVLDSGWVGNASKVIEFEEKFAQAVGKKYGIATNSATSALDLCIKAHGIRGGELITTPVTFVADASVGEFNGMDVTFADIDPDTLCIDPKSLKITPETRVIIAVDSHGRLADVGAIRALCAQIGRPDILVIEDAAHASITPGVGKDADLVVFSFQAVKTLPIFDGGMICTDDGEVAKKLKRMMWLGVEKSTFNRVGEKSYSWRYDIQLGNVIKGYMTDVQAVIGLGQLRRLEQTNEKRREIQFKYNQAFMGKDWIKLPAFSHTVQYYTPQWEDRDGLSDFLQDAGITTSVHFIPLSEMTYWKKGKKNPLPVTDSVWLKLLSLPVHDALTDEDTDYIIAKVQEFYHGK